MTRAMRSTSVAQSVCNDAHGLQLFRRAICVQCRAQLAALPLCNLCAMLRTNCCTTQPLKPYNRMQCNRQKSRRSLNRY